MAELSQLFPTAARDRQATLIVTGAGRPLVKARHPLRFLVTATVVPITAALPAAHGAAVTDATQRRL
ncbi:MAG: hypothetical protein ACRDNS_11475 [Trebonia sp.]